MTVYRDCDPATTCFEGPEGPYCAIGPCNIQITVDQIPVIAQPLPVYKLGDQVVVSSDYLCDIIDNVAPHAKLTTFGSQGASAAFDDDSWWALLIP